MCKEKIIAAMDGNEAAAHVAYAFTEVAAIYPITPSSPMAEKTDEWSAIGRKNLFGQPVKLIEMQSEAGAVGAVHGASESGALATSFTSSQGLMLMIPTMYRIAGTKQPAVLHVASRTVGTHAMSIFGDHSDVMNCRSTGFAMMSTGSVQEVMDLAAVAHLSAVKARIPFIHFFDGFRTSHEIQKIEVMDYEDLRPLLDMDAVKLHRDTALNPEHPTLRNTVQNPDVYFQVREANNRFYDALPDTVEYYFNEINKITGRSYKLFDYYGAPDAERVIIAMGSVSGTVMDTVDYLNARGEKVGYVQVRLYRPFSVERLLKAVPETVKSIAVLDRCKEHGAVGEALYEDVRSAFYASERRPVIVGGRYGLSSKDTDPAQIAAVFENLKAACPVDHFSVGIEDDVTHMSLRVGAPINTDLQQRLLNALSGDVTRYGRIFALARDLIDLVDIDYSALGKLHIKIRRLQKAKQDIFNVISHISGLCQRRCIRYCKRNVKNARKSLREKRFSGAGGSDEQDIALLQLHVVILRREANAFIVIIYRNGKRDLGALLSNDVLIEHLPDSRRRRYTRQLSLLFVNSIFVHIGREVRAQYGCTQSNTFIADIGIAAGYYAVNLVLSLAAEAAADSFVCIIVFLH